MSDIGWFKNDDNLHSHRKTRKAGLEAMGLWVVAGTWSSSQNTEGFVPTWFVQTWPRGEQLARRLVDAGFWDDATDGGDDGWRFHDWLDYNPSAEEEALKRKAAAERQRKHRRDKNGRYVTGAVTRDITRDITRDVPRDVMRYVTRESHHPVPARPDPTREDHLGGYLTNGDADASPPRFLDRCKAHQHVADPPNCGACADQRKAGRVLRVVPAERALRCSVHQLSHYGSCPGCAADEKAGNA